MIPINLLFQELKVRDNIYPFLILDVTLFSFLFTYIPIEALSTNASCFLMIYSKYS